MVEALDDVEQHPQDMEQDFDDKLQFQEQHGGDGMHMELIWKSRIIDELENRSST